MNRFSALVLLSMVAVLTSGCASKEGQRREFLSGYARALAWSPDAKWIVAIRQFDLVVHDATTLTPQLTHNSSTKAFKIRVPPAAVAFSPDGKTLATAGFDDGVVLWDALTWLPKARLIGADGATTVAFTPDGTQVIVAGPESALMVFDVISNSRVSTIVDSPSGVMSVAVSPDGKLLATGEINQQVRLWGLPGLELSTTKHDYFGPVLSVAYSPDGKLLASTAGGREARLLNLDNPSITFTLMDPAKPTKEQRVLDVMAFIMTQGLRTGSPYPKWPNFNCPLIFSPDAKFLALIRFSHELRSEYHVEVYDVASGACVSRYSGGISSLAFSPDGRRLAVSGIIRIILLDPLTGEEVGVDQ